MTGECGDEPIIWPCRAAHRLVDARQTNELGESEIEVFGCARHDQTGRERQCAARHGIDILLSLASPARICPGNPVRFPPTEQYL